MHKHGSLECYYPQKVPFYLLVKLFIERFESVKSELIYKYMYIIPPPTDSESLILINFVMYMFDMYQQGWN